MPVTKPVGDESLSSPAGDLTWAWATIIVYGEIEASVGFVSRWTPTGNFMSHTNYSWWVHGTQMDMGYGRTLQDRMRLDMFNYMMIPT